MDLYAFSEWLAATRLSLSIQNTSGAIAALQVVHIIGLATLVGLALNLALRIAGYGLLAEPRARLAAHFVPAIWICLGVLFLSGGLLIIAEPGRAVTNRVFYTKMCLLMLAVTLTLWLAAVARRQPETRTSLHVAGAALSMLVWAGIIVAGRLIAYYV